MSDDAARFEAVFFDLDGTLVSERMGVREARCAVGSELVRRGLTTVAPKGFADAVAHVVVDVLRENGGQWPPWFDMAGWFARALKRIDCELDPDSAAFAGVLAIYADERIERAAAIPGALEAVVAARRHGPVCVITNFTDGDMQRRKIASAGLEGQFDALFISGEVGCAKPDPEIFRHAARQLGVDVTRTVHIGNSVISDVEGALAAGAAAVLVEEGSRPRPDGLDEAVVWCEDLAAVVRWLEG